ncbi:MAG: LTA synthase family protein [Firmicutes bacterium]|nr:LTA synthase family protein [Bacillota bacterium]
MLKERVVAMKDKLESSVRKAMNRLKKDIIYVISNPKRATVTFFNHIIELIKNNILVFVFILVSIFTSTLLRFITINTAENILNIKPIIADLAIIIFLSGISFLLKEKHRFPYLMTCSIVTSLICVINSLYYTFYTSYVSVSLLGTVKYLFQVSDAVTESVLKIQDFSYLFAPIALGLTYYKLKKANKVPLKGRGNRAKKKAISLFAASGILALCFICMLTSLEIGRFAKQWNREYIVMKFGIYTYHLNDLVKSIEPKITSLFGYDNAKKIFTEYYQDTPNEQTKTNEYTGIFEGKNIISIHAESIQSVVMDLSFNGQELTPNLNKLAKESLYFSNFYTQVSVGTSSDSEFTLNTSLMPTNTGTAFVSYFNREYVTIPKLLKEKGYYAFSMHANNGSYWNREVMHKSLGYDKFYSKKDYEIDEVIGLGLSDKSFFRQSVEKIKEINAQGKPYYGTVIMLSNHTPFADVDKYGDFPVDIKEELRDENGNIVINEFTNEPEIVTYPYMEGTKLGNYFKSVHYADEALGEFLAALENEGLMEDTVVILYGDHDARQTKADFNRLYNYDKENDATLPETTENFKKIDIYQYEVLRKVPFLIYSKETKESLHKEITTVMGMYDVMPTLGNMFGFYNKYQLGKDIFNTTDDNIVVFPNGNWMTNKLYYNTQKGEYLPLKEEVITDEYIQSCQKYAEKLLNASDSLIVFDLIKKQEELIESDSDYIEEKVAE